ncbi:hypothetical protein Bhyg_05805, partial [Pseudolycoriella hygida]
MAKIIPFRLIVLIAFVFKFQGIEGIWSIEPSTPQFCLYDAFIPSKPINGKKKQELLNKMAKTISFLLIMLIAFVFKFQGIEGVWSIEPSTSQSCPQDAFIPSKPINGKVYLFPSLAADRRLDWYDTRGYCAKHCAEMATVLSEDENTRLLEFIKEIGFGTDIWLGAEINNREKFTTWNNGEPATYQPQKIGEYDQLGHTCASNWDINQRGFCNDLCMVKRLAVCQRNANWKVCPHQCNRYDH